MLSVFRNENKKFSLTEERLVKVACFKCRIDKKKCDKKLPICSRCSQLEVDCRPYVRRVKYSKISSAIVRFTLIENKELDAENKGEFSIYLY